MRRFGRPLPEDLGPGLHWCWPWPIETVTKRAARPHPDHRDRLSHHRAGEGARRPVSGRVPHGADGVRRLPDEAVMITGDGNLIELQGRSATTSPSRASTFSRPTTARHPAQCRRDRAAREGGRRTFADLLTRDRAVIQREITQRLRERCAQYGANGLGMEMDGVSLHDMHPPQEVVGAYDEVTRAMEDARQAHQRGHARWR